MKKILLCTLSVGFALLSFSQERLSLNVNPDVRFQTIDGFGASDAWRCQFVGKNWPIDKKEQIADWLFSSETDENGNPKGIGLSLWRFYLAAGTAEQGNKSGIANEWRRGESFLSPQGDWDWNKYEGQRWFLNAAKERGVSKFLAFTIAAPVQYARNGKGFASEGDIRFNVKADCVGDYAAYLAEVLQHFKEHEEITFEYISPFNEPQWDWDQGNQEGTPALNQELYNYINLLSKELVRRNLKTKIVAGEAATIDHISSYVKKDDRDNQMEVFWSKSSPYYLGNLANVEPIISGHSYFSVWPVKAQVESREELAEKMAQVNPEIGYWESEYCVLEANDEIGGGWKRDLEMPTALFVARIIHNDLTICNARSWQWWTALSQFDFKDGLVYLDAGTQDVTGAMGADTESLKKDGIARDSKLMWAFGNYSRFIRPGMVRVEARLDGINNLAHDDGLMVSAYQSSDGRELVVVIVNTTESAFTIDSTSTGGATSTKMYLTDKEHKLERLKVSPEKIEIRPRSVSTLCFSKK
ncbi:glycoside hydrolase [Mangrovibacterium lignilyticum]|uniref:glycoside hydrolase n=1 Tax=Mangrovibacterium lignilyticum TaxID=2668052 RepID=UPI0013D3B2F8|nr:glycoside hydrolase [Mangrovibacterium lignilyticum]